MRVLVADDYGNMRFLLRFYFETAGHDVGEATSGPEASEKCEGYDAVILDCMPNCNDLVAKLRPAAVVVLSGYEVRDSSRFVPGADAYYVKGVCTCEELVEGLEALVASRGRSSEEVT